MRKDKNILVVTYWSINNALIHTYTLPYLRQIASYLENDAKIYLVTLSEPGTLNKTETVAFIQTLAKENIEVINFNYSPFGFKMLSTFLFLFPYLILVSLFKHVRAIHGWCTPGGAIAWTISLFSGKPLILDSFEPHAESMVESGVWKKKSVSFRILFLLEKLQLKRAKEVICATEGMIKHSQELYGIKKARYFVKPAGVDLHLFDPDLRTTPVVPFELKHRVCVYAGKFGGIYLKEEVFDFFKAAYEFWNGNFSVLLLSHHTEQEIQHLCQLSGLDRQCVKLLHVNHKDVAAYLKLAHFAISPVKPIPSKLYCSPIKNGEYWAMGLPVVITDNISVDSQLIRENHIGYVLREFNSAEYTTCLSEIEKIIRTEHIGNKIRQIAREKRAFENSKSIYAAIYARGEVYSNEIK